MTFTISHRFHHLFFTVYTVILLLLKKNSMAQGKSTYVTGKPGAERKQTYIYYVTEYRKRCNIAKKSHVASSRVPQISLSSWMCNVYSIANDDKAWDYEDGFSLVNIQMKMNTETFDQLCIMRTITTQLKRPYINYNTLKVQPT